RWRRGECGARSGGCVSTGRTARTDPCLRCALTSDFSLNERAWTLAEGCIARADELHVSLTVLPSGARVVDAGVNAAGGLEAGLALAQICMGGLGRIEFAPV